MSFEEKMTERTKNKIKTISFLAAVGVMFIHSYDVPSYSLTNDFEKVIAFIEEWLSVSLFGHAAVSLFFLQSGYLFSKGLKSIADWKDKLLRRIKSLGIPYVFWCFMGWLVFFACSLIPQISARMNIHAGFSLEELYWTFIAIKYSHHLWYIQSLFLYFLISPLLLLLSKKKVVVYISFFILLTLSVLGIDLQWFNIIRFTTFFAGFMIEKNYPEIVEKHSKIVSWLSLILLVILSCSITIFKNDYIDRLCYFIFPLLIWLVYDLVNDKLTRNRFYVTLCTLSFFIYCGHGILIECIKQVFSIIGDGWLVMLVSYFLSPFLTLVILIGIAFLLKRIFPKFLGVVTGGRS